MSNKKGPSPIPQMDQIEILDPVLKQGFAQLPRAVLKAQKLSRNAKCLYALLLDYAWQAGSCFPGQSRLAKDLDVSRRTIINDLNELRKYQLIDWKQRGMNKTNVYYLLPLAQNPNLKRQLADSKGEVQNPAHPEVQDLATHEVQNPADLIDSEEYTQIDLDSVYISNGKATLRDRLMQSEPDPEPQRKGRGVTSINQALEGAQSRIARARANPESLPSGVPPNLAHYVTAWSRELHDSEHVKSNITQAFRLMQQTGMNETAFMQKMTEARAITKERGNIKKPAKEYGEFGTKNKVPYWFAVLRDLLGLKEEDTSNNHRYSSS